jgi:ketosteroid isomerase-like protein
MSQENVEVVRRVYDALSGRDFNTFRALHDPDVELTPLRPEGATYRGHDGVRRYWDELFDVFPDFNVEIDDIREIGDLMLITARIRGHGMGSNVPIEQPIWQVGELRAGRIIWWRSFACKSEALEAAGQRE